MHLVTKQPRKLEMEGTLSAIFFVKTSYYDMFCVPLAVNFYNHQMNLETKIRLKFNDSL